MNLPRSGEGPAAKAELDGRTSAAVAAEAAAVLKNLLLVQGEPIDVLSKCNSQQAEISLRPSLS
jgi:hypothetical protein